MNKVLYYYLKKIIIIIIIIIIIEKTHTILVQHCVWRQSALNVYFFILAQEEVETD